MSKKKTRRLAAIMFTDIAGYTRLMQESESRASQIRNRHREVFDRFHEAFKGQILQYYGDGTLSIFDSCVDAVQCAIAMQKELQQEPVVPLRIGIHLGDIVTSESDIYGDGVNLAARVESLGVPNAVLISEDVRKQVKNHEIEMVSMGSFELKNVTEAVEVFAVKAEGLLVPEPEFLSGKAKRVKTKPLNNRWSRLRSLGLAVGVILAIGLPSITKIRQIVNEKKQIEWAYETAIPEIEAMIDSSDMGNMDTWRAFNLASQIEQLIPGLPQVAQLRNRSSRVIKFYSYPDEANIYAKPYYEGDSAFQWIGKTPIEEIRLPSGYMSLKIEKKGYELINDVINNWWPLEEWSYTLDSTGTIPPNMSMVRPHLDSLLMSFSEMDTFFRYPDTYLVDQYEVSNKEYMAFILAGGYKNRHYWKEPFYDESGKELNWEDAMSKFVDNTARPGPSIWQAGTYPEGEDDFPVEGVSWYEATAYAEYAGKQLPSIYHLKYLTGGAWIIGELIKSAHLNQPHSRKRSSDLNRGLWGVHEIRGNLREWCYNSNQRRYKFIVGAAYDDPEYLANQFNYSRPPIDRSKGNGFRCIKSIQYPSYTGPLYQETNINIRDYRNEQPISDDQFEAILSQFRYDKQKLKLESIDTIEKDYWTRQKVVLESPGEKEKMSVYLFLPKNAAPPFQTVLFWKGRDALMAGPSEQNIESFRLNFLIRSGRAVVFPVISGTYERKNSLAKDCADWRICDKRNKIRWVQEFQKTLDYLETRDDIDMEKIAFLGTSWGAEHGYMQVAVDHRLKAAIFRLGGLPIHTDLPLPEVDIINYCPRVTQPVLMLNGIHDSTNPFLECVLPTFNFLGTPDENKDLKRYNDAHMVPQNEYIKESLAFLDRHFGAITPLVK